MVCHEDNDVCIRVCRTGRNQTMRHLGRTHGITIAWLHEQYKAGAYALEYEPSASMAADIFTKSFSNPLAFDAVCWLVFVCHAADVFRFCALGGVPLPPPQGGLKAGEWDIKPDGSGTWTRFDRSAVRCRSLFKTGPARSEVYERVTVDANTGEVLHTLTGYQTAKVLDQELPPPVPRAIKSIFHFRATAAKIPDHARVKGEAAAAAARPWPEYMDQWR